MITNSSTGMPTKRPSVCSTVRPLPGSAPSSGGMTVAAAGGPGVVRLFEILEDEIRICLSLLGVNHYGELDRSYIRPARQVVAPHVHSPFPHLDLPRETY